jgi:ParB-like nuclease domain.
VAAADVKPEQRTIALKSLDLDPRNPRLVVDGTPTQAELLEQLYEDESLDELVHSFLQNGYFAEEPLVVVPDGKRFTVVEGNRRLATLKLLMDKELRRRVRVGGWPTATPAQARRLQNIPCVVYPDRRSVLPFLGFRHISGARKWRPFQKARFVAQMLEDGRTLVEIEETLGDDTQTVKKLYQQYVVFDQLVTQLDFPAGPVRSRFSLLEVALGQRPIKKHLGLPHRLPTEAVDELIDDEHLDELLEVASWVFGDGEQAAIIADGREITSKLSKIVADEDALDELRASRDLDSAFERLGGESKYLQRRISVAERALRDVLGLLPLYIDDDMVRSAVGRLLALTQTIQHQVDEHSDATVDAR